MFVLVVNVWLSWICCYWKQWSSHGILIASSMLCNCNMLWFFYRCLSQSRPDVAFVKCNFPRSIMKKITFLSAKHISMSGLRSSAVVAMTTLLGPPWYCHVIGCCHRKPEFFFLTDYWPRPYLPSWMFFMFWVCLPTWRERHFLFVDNWHYLMVSLVSYHFVALYTFMWYCKCIPESVPDCWLFLLFDVFSATRVHWKTMLWAIMMKWLMSPSKWLR